MTTSRDVDTQLGAGNTHADGHTAVHHGSVGHEARDVNVRPVFVSFVGLLVVTIGSLLLMYAVLRAFTASDLAQSAPASPLAASYGRHEPPEPRLQVAPRDDLYRLHEQEDAMLHGYGWVDRGAGVARIPIERAIELLAKRGLPSAPPPAAEGKR